MLQRTKKLLTFSLISAVMLTSTACSGSKRASSWEKVGEICQGYLDRATHAAGGDFFPYIPDAYDRSAVAVIQDGNKFAAIGLIDPRKRQYIGTKPSVDCIAIKPFSKDTKSGMPGVFVLASREDFLEPKERDLSLYWTELDKGYSEGSKSDGFVATYTFSLDQKNGNITAKRSGVGYAGNKPSWMDKDRYYFVGQKVSERYSWTN